MICTGWVREGQRQGKGGGGKWLFRERTLWQYDFRLVFLCFKIQVIHALGQLLCSFLWICQLACSIILVIGKVFFKSLRVGRDFL